MARKKARLDVEKLLSELIRVLHDEDMIGTAQVIEIFESAGSDEEQAMALLEESSDASDLEFEDTDDEDDDDF